MVTYHHERPLRTSTFPIVVLVSKLVRRAVVAAITSRPFLGRSGSRSVFDAGSRKLPKDLRNHAQVMSTITAQISFCGRYHPRLAIRPYAGGRGRFHVIRRRSMIRKSKFCAVTLIAATRIAVLGLSSPVFAAQYGPSYWSPSQTGGGSAGYNYYLSKDNRLKRHVGSHHSGATKVK